MPRAAGAALQSTAQDKTIVGNSRLGGILITHKTGTEIGSENVGDLECDLVLSIATGFNFRIF